MQLRIDDQGRVLCLYDELIDLAVLGTLSMRRASHVEPAASSCWWVDFAPLAGPRLGPFQQRSQALTAEVGWLQGHLFGEVRIP